MSDDDADQGLYDFAPEAPPTKPQTVLKVKPLPVVALDSPAVISYRGKKEDKNKRVDTEQIKNVYLPLGLLAGGVFIELLSAIIWGHHLATALASLAVDLTLGTAVMLGAMLIAAKVRGIDLGKTYVSAYKLAAVAIAPAAVMEFVNPIAQFIPFGFIISFVVEFALFFALLGALFDMDESDTWYCVGVLFVTRVALYLVLLFVFHA